jgi:predicted transcriptional regulator
MTAESDLRKVATQYRKARERLTVARVELVPLVVAAREQGMTLNAIAEIVGVSRQRILEILKQ